MTTANSTPLLSQPFTYQPLPSPTCIRLIERTSPSSDGTLAFSLKPYDLNDQATTYHCFSYTWGNPFAHGTQFRAHYLSVDPEYEAANRIPILVNGQLLHVQKNLHDALRTICEDVLTREVNHPDPIQGRTYLHFAADSGRSDAVKLWIQHGADVHAKDVNDQTALHYAARKGHQECVRILCQGGSLRSAKDDNGRTPLDLAKDGNQHSVVSLLQSLHDHLDPQTPSIPLLKDGAHKRIWADAICINQNDISEKSSQVTMMDKIYSQASFVVAWLGPSDQLTSAGLKALNTLAVNAKKFQESQIEPYGGSAKNFQDADIPFISREEWVGLASIFQRQWFRRAWIVQEAILPTTLILHIGSDILSWTSLGLVSEALRQNEAKLGTNRSTGFVGKDDVAVPVEWNMAEMSKWRENMNHAQGSNVKADAYKRLFTLDELITGFWTFRATEPKDKIFSLYGLINVFSTQRLSTDYGRSIESVYTSATRQIIRETQNLAALANCIFSKDRLGSLPGWVPDYSLQGINPIPHVFDADKGLTFQVSQTPQGENDDGLVLKIRGKYVGKVSRVGGRPDTSSMGMYRFDPNWTKLALSLRKPSNDGQAPKRSLTEILWRTLCINMSHGSLFDASIYGRQAPRDYGDQFMILLLLFILAGADQKVNEKVGMKPELHEITISRTGYDPFDIDMAGVLDDLDALDEHDGDIGWAPRRDEVLSIWNDVKYTMVRNTAMDDNGGPNDFYLPADVMEGKARCVGPGYVRPNTRLFQKCMGIGRAFSMMYGGRQLITVDDTYLGLASLSVQVGDEVWILPGLKSPAILRDTCATSSSSCARRRFVCASYVHELMDGEAVSQSNGNASLVDVELE